jgi:hypothetical protein
MTLGDAHEWLRFAANQLLCDGDSLGQAMCAEWAQKCLPKERADEIVNVIADALD